MMRSALLWLFSLMESFVKPITNRYLLASMLVNASKKGIRIWQVEVSKTRFGIAISSMPIYVISTVTLKRHIALQYFSFCALCNHL